MLFSKWIVNSISLRTCVQINDESNESNFFFETSSPIIMRLIEMVLCSHSYTACLSASQIREISVKIPFTFGQFLAHCSNCVLFQGTRDDHANVFTTDARKKIDASILLSNQTIWILSCSRGAALFDLLLSIICRINISSWFEKNMKRMRYFIECWLSF